MSHEQSETVKNRNGKWVNVYGGKTKKRGQKLPGSKEYDTVEEATAAARARSRSIDAKTHKRGKDPDADPDAKSGRSRVRQELRRRAKKSK